jgi:aminoglycoside phosphotransferase (APT) family kinase protein
VVPEPLGYVDDHRLVLMEYLAGLPLEAVLLDAADAAAAREATRVAARTLVRLHDLPADGLRPARAEPDHVRRLAGRLALIAPRLAEAVLELLDSIPDDGGARRFVHGAYAARQLLLRGDRAAVVDLDTAGAGDRAADLGNFMAGLHARAMLGARPMLRDIADDFLAAYLAEAPADGLAARARRAQAVALARTALNSHCKPRQWTSLSAADVPTLLLAEAAACLRAA